MIRFTKALAVAAVALMLPTVASALGISIVSVFESGLQDGVIQVGESITFDLRLENDGEDRVSGLDVLVFGHDQTADTSGTISSGLTNLGGNGALAGDGAVVGAVFLQASGLSVSGLGPNVVPFPTDLFEVNILDPEFVRTQLFGGLLLAGSVGTGQLDTGIFGTTIADGDIHFRVVFMNIPTQIGTSFIDLQFGTSEALGAVAVGDDGSILAFSNASMSLTVIPEPGTALLMGLGLAGLASSTRRR